MTVQTLVVTVDRKDRDLPQKMNLRTDAIIGNQCGKEKSEYFEYNGHQIQQYAFASRGVGINRNEVLMRASADICVLADDDMTFLDGYEETVRYWFEKLPQADMLVFNLQEARPRRYENTAVRRITPYNYGRYGAARLAFRTEAVRFSGVMFNTMFGGGCRYSCGEDTLFLRDCLRKGLRLYGVPAALACIEDGNSTWFRGYTDKFFFDKGVLYYALDGKLCKIHALLHCFRCRRKYRQYGWLNAARQMLKGIGSVR